MSLRLLSVLLLSLSASLALADATVPTADKAGAADPAGLGRYEGAFIVEQQAKAYDELVLPTAALTPNPDDEKRDGMNNRLMQSTSQLALDGKLTRTVYVLPAGRSSLEVLRNYQQLIQDKGGQSLSRKLEDDLKITTQSMSYAGGGTVSVPAQPATASPLPAASANGAHACSCHEKPAAAAHANGTGNGVAPAYFAPRPLVTESKSVSASEAPSFQVNGRPDFARMSPTDRLAYHRQRLGLGR